jgi:methionyl aminopeptidase
VEFPPFSVEEQFQIPMDGCPANKKETVGETMPVPEQYRKAGKIAREVRTWIKQNVRPGLSIYELSEGVEGFIRRSGAQPAFPCGIGVNQVAAHFSPQVEDGTVIKEEDVVKVDYGVHIDGFIADTAVTLTFNPEYGAMLDATEEALASAIEVAKKDQRIGEIGRAIEEVATKNGFKPINNLSGHTLERNTVHAGKSIPNLYMPNLPVLKKDDVFAIEPFLTTSDASGYVVDGPDTTIYSLVVRKKTGIKELDDFVSLIWDRRNTLPFTPKWFKEFYDSEKLKRLLEELVDRRIVRDYSTLVEASGKPVAQFEHTMGFDSGKLVILT